MRRSAEERWGVWPLPFGGISRVFALIESIKRPCRKIERVSMHMGTWFGPSNSRLTVTVSFDHPVIITGQEQQQSGSESSGHARGVDGAAGLKRGSRREGRWRWSGLLQRWQQRRGHHHHSAAATHHPADPQVGQECGRAAAVRPPITIGGVCVGKRFFLGKRGLSHRHPPTPGCIQTKARPRCRRCPCLPAVPGRPGASLGRRLPSPRLAGAAAAATAAPPTREAASRGSGKGKNRRRGRGSSTIANAETMAAGGPERARPAAAAIAVVAIGGQQQHAAGWRRRRWRRRQPKS